MQDARSLRFVHFFPKEKHMFFLAQGAFGSHPFEIRSSTRIEHNFGTPKKLQRPTIAVCHPPRRSSLQRPVAGGNETAKVENGETDDWYLSQIIGAGHEHAKQLFSGKRKRHTRAIERKNQLSLSQGTTIWIFLNTSLKAWYLTSSTPLQELISAWYILQTS